MRCGQLIARDLHVDVQSGHFDDVAATPVDDRILVDADVAEQFAGPAHESTDRRSPAIRRAGRPHLGTERLGPPPRIGVQEESGRDQAQLHTPEVVVLDASDTADKRHLPGHGEPQHLHLFLLVHGDRGLHNGVRLAQVSQGCRAVLAPPTCAGREPCPHRKHARSTAGTGVRLGALPPRPAVRRADISADAAVPN